MYNPLIGSLRRLSDSAVNEKIAELQVKYFQTNNPSMQTQILASLNNYKEEALRRSEELFKKTKANDEEDLDGLINIS